MIAIVSIVNIHHYISLQIVFLMMRTFRIYCLSNFQIYKTVSLTVVTMIYIISFILTYLTTGILYLLTNLHPFPFSIPSLCIYEFGLF